MTKQLTPETLQPTDKQAIQEIIQAPTDNSLFERRKLLHDFRRFLGLETGDQLRKYRDYFSEMENPQIYLEILNLVSTEPNPKKVFDNTKKVGSD